MATTIVAKELKPKHIIKSSSGEVIAGVAGARLRIFRMDASPTGDVSGLTTFNDGVTTYYGGYDWKEGAHYGFDFNGLAYIELPTGLGLDITLGTAQDTAVNVMYEVVTP